MRCRIRRLVAEQSVLVMLMRCTDAAALAVEHIHEGMDNVDMGNVKPAWWSGKIRLHAAACMQTIGTCKEWTSAVRDGGT